MKEEVATLTKLHPALLDSVVRWRGVGAWGATATLLRTVKSGAVSIDTHAEGVLLHLVPGVATSKRQRSSGPFVAQGHVDGLHSVDRQMLSMVFDGIAQARSIDIAELARFRRAHPLEFWRRLKVWREAVDSEATRLKEDGRLRASRGVIMARRGSLVDALYDESLSNGEWADCIGVALVAGLDDVVSKSAASRLRDGQRGCASGPAAAVWLSCVRIGKHTGIDALRRLYSPFRPSGYPPAQYTKLVLPPMGAGRVRIVDDGETRLGG
jgi:hypothetical protein